MTDNKETNRNRATMAPGGCECSKCGCVFIGGETHTECGICAKEPKQAPAVEAGTRDERVSMIQTLMLDWINAKPGYEAKAVWNRIEGKLAALARASAEREDRYRQLLAAAYQIAGLVDAPVRFLDAFCDGADGTPIENGIDCLLPVTIEEIGAARAPEAAPDEDYWRDQAWRIFGYKMLCENNHKAIAEHLQAIDASLPGDGDFVFSITCASEAAAGEPVAYVPVHPRTGPLWANTVPSLDSDRPAHYPVRALCYAAPQPASEPKKQNADGLLRRWYEGTCDGSIATSDARYSVVSDTAEYLTQPASEQQAARGLSDDELDLFRETVDQFEDCGETTTDHCTLMKWANDGLLECEHFMVTAAGNALLAAKGDGHE